MFEPEHIVNALRRVPQCISIEVLGRSRESFTSSAGTPTRQREGVLLTTLGLSSSLRPRAPRSQRPKARPDRPENTVDQRLQPTSLFVKTSTRISCGCELARGLTSLNASRRLAHFGGLCHENESVVFSQFSDSAEPLTFRHHGNRLLGPLARSRPFVSHVREKHGRVTVRSVFHRCALHSRPSKPGRSVYSPARAATARPDKRSTPFHCEMFALAHEVIPQLAPLGNAVFAAHLQSRRLPSTSATQHDLRTRTTKLSAPAALLRSDLLEEMTGAPSGKRDRRTDGARPVAVLTRGAARNGFPRWNTFPDTFVAHPALAS